jgi:hypothetical protein
MNDVHEDHYAIQCDTEKKRSIVTLSQNKLWMHSDRATHQSTIYNSLVVSNFILDCLYQTWKVIGHVYTS